MADDAHRLKLTDFLDLATLQEIQDGFAAVANVRAVITDADGNVLTQAAPTRQFLRRQQAIAQQAEQDQSAVPQREGREYVAPIIVNDQRLGTIRMAARNGAGASIDSIDEARLATLSEKLGLDVKQVRSMVSPLVRNRSTRPAAIQFLFLLANAIARLCFQEYQLRQRVAELTAISTVATMLAEARDLNDVLQRTVQVVCEVMQTKAASIRLIDRENHDELVTKAVWNLSPQYLNKGPVRLSKSAVDELALSEQGYAYVRDMKTDPRVQYPGEAQREGIASVLSVGMRHHGEAIGVLRVYTAIEQEFTPLQVNLLKAIAAHAAAAIENTRLSAEAIEAERLERQVRMAADVQMRMLPRSAPALAGVELASVYVPTHELGGDFFDFIPLPDDNLGLVIADVSGKGVPASLIMASVRAALRAQVDNLYYLYEVMHRLNLMLCRDTRPTEFVTLFYGVLHVSNRRLTYCNAGHPPPLLMRGSALHELDSDNMVLGINPDEEFAQSIVDLNADDVLLLYTDGLTDAMNFAGEIFGKERLKQSLLSSRGSAEVIAQNVLWQMRKFAGLTRRTDDTTMVVARMK